MPAIGAPVSASLLGTALSNAIQLIEARGGGGWQELTWGDFHKARFPHQVFRHIPVVGGLLAEELATDGDFYTVSRGTPIYADQGRLFEHVHEDGVDLGEPVDRAIGERGEGHEDGIALGTSFAKSGAALGAVAVVLARRALRAPSR